MIAVLHEPKVLLIDNVFEIYSQSERKILLKTLKKIMCDNNSTIIYFSSNLNNICESDKIIILSNFNILKETNFYEIYNNDKVFYENGLEIPFIYDLNNKLSIYNIINKNYIDMEEMVDDIWP